MSEELDYEFWNGVISATTLKLVKDFPEVEYDDLYQMLWELVIRSHNSSYQINDAMGFLYKAGQRLAWNDRKEQLRMSCQYNYRPSDVRKILETAFHPLEWEDSYVPDDARSLGGGDTVELSSEMSWALKRLRRKKGGKAHYEALVKRFRDGEIPHNASAERKRVDLAIDAVTEILNWYVRPEDQTIGQREILSNVQAQHVIKRQWED